MNQLLGNAIVGQSGGPTAVMNATLSGVIRGVRDSRHGGRIRKLYAMRNGIEGFLREEMIDLTELFDREEKLEMLERTPASALGTCRKKLPEVDTNDEVYARILALFQKHDIRYFFYIGGNDSMDTVNKLSRYTNSVGYEMMILGIPKTIDNDLVLTDHTPGFGSAAKYVAVTTQEIIRDCAVYTVPAVTIIEVMGRDAGWLTAASAVGRIINGVEPDYVYLPEHAFSTDKFFSDIKQALARHPNVVVAVSEGVRFENGCYVGESLQSSDRDEYGHAYLAGVGKVLEQAVKREFGCKVRSIELNLPQRCAAHLLSKTDIDEAIQIGSQAVELAGQGISRVMLNYQRVSQDPYRVEIGYVDVSRVANHVRLVDNSMIVPEGNHVTDACCRYIAPLIVGELHSPFENGLPKHWEF